jgi:seryl-tRNA synthetase
MLDIQFIRDNSELVAEKSKQKGYDVDVAKLLEKDKQRRELVQKIELLRAQRNELAAKLKQGKPDSKSIDEGKKLKDELSNLEDQLKPIEEVYFGLLKAVPNMPSDDVPVGTSEADNKEAKQWGVKPKFAFKPKTHWELAEERGLIDKARAAKVAGARFAYLKGDLVKLQFALIQFVIDTLTDEKKLKKIVQDFKLEKLSTKPFMPILPPLMIKTDVYDAMDRLEPRDDRYQIAGEELWLQGSAEHTLGSMYLDEILTADQLPLRYLGYATSFRKEAGSYGKDTEGIIRMHQFDKLEMESFTLPQDGMKEHLFMIAIQEYLMQQLNLPYRVLQKCTADIGKPNARGVDIEVWLPGADAYKETHTADYMTDYQARRLNTRVKVVRQQPGHASEANVLVHTNDATGLALGRTLVAIIENYQTKNGQIDVPKVLLPYMNGTATI